jgi:uncharacterized integral membrane protein
VGHTSRWFLLIVLVLAVAVGGLFTVQNSMRVTELSLNLWVVAFQLEDPQPIPYLLLGAFGGGVILAGAIGSFNRLGLQRRVRELEQEAARSSLRKPDDDWT